MKSRLEISALETHLGYWLRFVSNHVSHSFSLKLETHGITVAEWVVLRELLRLGETSPGVLAESLGLTRGAVSKLVERLVGKEFIDRVPNTTDRRAQSVKLTQAGRALVPDLALLADQNDAEYFGHLDPVQRQALLELLQDITRRHGLKGPPLD